jgi:ribosomal protein S18 acetylase RimI-like enzyme
MKELHIRKAKTDEYFIALNLLKEAAVWLKERQINYWQSWLNPDENYKNWIKSGFNLGQFYFVEKNDEIIAMYRLQHDDEPFWGKRDDSAVYVHSLTTKRKLHGEQLGYSILKIIEEIARQDNRHYLRLDCGVDNKALCQYYSNFGFKQTGTKVVNGSKEALFEKDIR